MEGSKGGKNLLGYIGVWEVDLSRNGEVRFWMWVGEGKKETIYSFRETGRELLLLSSLLHKPGSQGFLVF